MKNDSGSKIFEISKKIINIPRSICGPGIRTTLRALKLYNNKLVINNIRSGTKVFDWIIPNEWHVKKAYLSYDNKGNKILDISQNFLHLLNYSSKFIGKINFNNLKKHLFFLKDQPDAIPYVTSYYKNNWGFCLSHNQFKKIDKRKNFYVHIDTSKKKGFLNYGEIEKKGITKNIILFSSYICHPNLANNEISGPSLNIYFSNFIQKLKTRYTYKFVFVPETIGSIVFINKNLNLLKKKMIAGINLTCIGDERNYSFIPTKYNASLPDKIIRHHLKYKIKKYIEYNWNKRGSDERQYNSPNVDLPMVTLMRSKFGAYPEYHTSLDKLGKVVTKKGLEQSFEMLIDLFILFENNLYPKTKILCEPHLTKYNLIHTIGTKKNVTSNSMVLDILTYCDGKNSIIDIAEKLDVYALKIFPLIKELNEKKIITLDFNMSHLDLIKN